MRVRKQRGLLSESMSTVKEVNTKEEFIDYFLSDWMKEGEFVVENYNTYDKRIDWQTYIVYHKHSGRSEAMGFADSPMPEEWGKVEIN